MISWETAIPVLLLLVEKDDWTPPGWCLSATEVLKGRRGVEVELKLYPGAARGFDSINLSRHVFASR
ncbi:MAG: hypothetical protein DMD91_17850 [Candidatus Rokuibacteriota bacterium]|nr:MAG: hypothetical protein DMD91_17850 [Candidatus Rokubacteria bacterium]